MYNPFNPNFSLQQHFVNIVATKLAFFTMDTFVHYIGLSVNIYILELLNNKIDGLLNLNENTSQLLITQQVIQEEANIL